MNLSLIKDKQHSKFFKNMVNVIDLKFCTMLERLLFPNYVNATVN